MGKGTTVKENFTGKENYWRKELLGKGTTGGRELQKKSNLQAMPSVNFGDRHFWELKTSLAKSSTGKGNFCERKLH